METRLSVKRQVYALLLIVILLCIGIAYAVLQRQLTIQGTTTIAKNTWKVEFANLGDVSKSSTTEVSSPAAINDTKTGVTFTVDLNYPGDYYEFYVDVVNSGNIDAMVGSVVKTPNLSEAQQQYFNFIVTYADGSEIEAKDKLPWLQTGMAEGSNKERIRVLLQYKEGALAPGTETLSLSVAITYVQADGTWKERTKSSFYQLLKSAGENNSDGLVLDSTKNLIKSTTSSVVKLNQTSVQNNTDGVYMLAPTSTSPYPIYYYRGNVNNNVIFNGFCWKMIRTTSTGGVKLIYNGVPTEGACNASGAAQQLENTVYNSSYSDPVYVKYETSGIKTKVESWFETNMTGENDVQDILEDTPFYNESTYTEFDTATSLAKGTFPAGARIWGDFTTWKNSESIDNNYIALGTSTYSDNDTFMVGNNKTSYKVGNITSDEVMLAGGRGYSDTSDNNGANNSYYLYTGQVYWTMSPSNVNSSGIAIVLRVDSYGYIIGNRVNYSNGVRPVVSLKAGTTYLVTGDPDGSAAKPYVVKQ